MEVYRLWVKIFAVAFGMGVVSGIVLSYQFGTNWSSFSDKVGSVMGPMLGYEVLTAFFLEASFLGVMLFGWNRVGPRLHFFATTMVAVGTLFSAFWILAAISWMHTPAGFEPGPEGTYWPADWTEIIFSPSTAYRFFHMVIACYLTTAFVVLGTGCWYLLKNRCAEHGRVMVGYAAWLVLVLAPAQMLAGDFHGLNTFEHQTVKVAAMEGLWETTAGAPLVLFAVPDEEEETNRFEIAVPKLSSIILTHDAEGVVPGLKDWPEDERPPVIPVFYSFRVMVGLGMLMILTGIIAAYLRWRGRLFDNRLFLRWGVLMIPSGFISVLAGWFVTEIGRQPWMVYGLLRTSDMVSPVPGASVALSLALFVVVYTIIFGAGMYFMLGLVKKGPEGEK